MSLQLYKHKAVQTTAYYIPSFDKGFTCLLMFYFWQIPSANIIAIFQFVLSCLDCNFTKATYIRYYVMLEDGHMVEH